MVKGFFYNGQTKCALRDRFGEQRRENKTSDAVPQHFNQKGHKLTDIELIPLEPIRRARESFYTDNTKTMQPRGKKREDGRRFFTFLTILLCFWYTIIIIHLLSFFCAVIGPFHLESFTLLSMPKLTVTVPHTIHIQNEMM